MSTPPSPPILRCEGCGDLFADEPHLLRHIGETGHAPHQPRLLEAERRRATQPVETMGMDPYYSAALDEIYRLRALLAVEAVHSSTYHLRYRSLLKAVVESTEKQIERMRLAAKGQVGEATKQFLRWTEISKPALRAAGASETLTRWQWENEVGIEPGQMSAYARQLVEANPDRKIQNIKAFRERYGVSLKDAKDLIDRASQGL